MANNKYEKIDFGTGQNTPTGDTIYDAFDKVNKAFDEIENDIESLDTKVDDEVTTINNRINEVVEDVNDVINNEIANINTTITELSNDFNEIENDIESLDTKVDSEVTTINNRIDDVVEDVNDVINTEITNINVTITELSNDFNEFEAETEQKLIDLETEIDGTLVLKKSTNGGVYFNNRDESKFNVLGLNSIDLSYNYVVGASGAKIGAMGENSIAIGGNTSTIGMFSSSIGYNTQSGGSYSIAIGYRSKTAGGGFGSSAIGFNCNANGYSSSAFGNITTTNARESVAIGTNLIANNYGSIVIGRYNEAPATIETDYTVGSPLFIIGNGTSARSNAYILNNNGTSTQWGIASYSSDFSANFTDNSLVSKKYADIKFESVGIFPNQQTRIGQGANTTHQWSSAFGFGAKANNQLSTAIGGGTEAYRNSVAIGCMNYALTDSVVIGNELGASVDNVILVGVGLFPQHRGEIILGRFNKIADNQVNVLNPTNNLFTIANGSSVVNRSNAFVILNNGKVELSNVTTYNGDYSASFTEHSLVDKKYVDDNVASTVNTAISTILDGAPETFDTLKEIADWIENDGVDAGELAESIALKVDKTAFETFKTSNTAIINGNYNTLNTSISSIYTSLNDRIFSNHNEIMPRLGTVESKATANAGRIEFVNTNLESRISSLQTTVNDNYSSLSTRLGPIPLQIEQLQTNHTSLNNRVSAMYTNSSIDGYISGIRGELTSETSFINGTINNNILPRLATVENKFNQYYTISQTNTKLPNIIVDNDLSTGTTGFLLNDKYPNLKIGDYIIDTIANKIYLKIKLSASASWVTLPFTFLQDEIS